MPSINRPLSTCIAILACLLTASAHCVTGYVRVNLIGYESGLSARAYLMTTSAVSGVSFVVKNSGGTTVASGKVGAKLGAWGSYSVYPIDFTLSTADTYTVSVSGSVSATSPKFRVDTAANLYTSALANALSFYENERDGKNFGAAWKRTGDKGEYLSVRLDDPSLSAPINCRLVKTGGEQGYSLTWERKRS